MPEPDPRRVRMVELRRQLEVLAVQVLATPIDSLERAALDELFVERLKQVLDLRLELEN
ncbi:hypothetical protein KBY82_07360 [Cyanobium sp. AMD-g]|uniref:hypothetical protein n=1 Tax=Cyanobium sp. AMD-g TaxID=2823699 RepID=UPI0020CBBAA3|nr:hypothetical protein [Cyanobium sp. AMD-g]MCP9930596.1 hypothetical protein [Cyanobium sp. AMD-g]